MSESDRDQALERLLRGSRGPDNVAGSANDHLDAETAAAWVERRLESREISAIESHVADCDRCQELVAAMVRTMPVPAAADARPRWRLAWLVPIGATAAALTIWFTVGQRDRATFVEQMAERTATAPIAEPAPRPDARQEAPQTEPMRGPSPAESRERASSSLAKTADAATPAEMQVRAIASADSKQKAEAAKETSAATDAAAAPETARRAAPSPAPAAAQARSDALRSTTAGIEVRSVDPDERWRFAGAGVMQHSIDGGRTWTNAPISPDLQITSGTSPVASVCWVAGRAGVVMLTIDGQSWRRLSFPTEVDLVSIAAPDARTATVTAADGRQFQTSDGGQTWRCRACR